MRKSVFIIGSVWVEPQSSAAGSRMLQLIQFFQANDYEVSFGTTAKKNTHSFDLESINVSTYHLALNDSSFDDLLKSISPHIVIFDRFMTEEQFGWRVTERCPNAIRILDTEDLHCLRRTREKKYKAKQNFQLVDLLSEDISKREIASILRCDLSLIISKFEMTLLKEVFKIDEQLLLYLPFLLDLSREGEVPSFQERNHFVSVGNFLHAPNLDSVIRLKREIWPFIRRQLPNAELHIYGAYPVQQVLEFHHPDEGFYIHGFVEDSNQVFRKARVLLAPLSFGAGLKGKFMDAMVNGCPSVTTSIGIEGYSSPEDWCGCVADKDQDFAAKAVRLYSDESLWMSAQEKRTVIVKCFDKELHEANLLHCLNRLRKELKTHRQQNFLGSLLQHHSMKSSKYLSKWIEEKNKTT